MMDRKLYRSRQDRMIGGVCGGLAAYFGADVTLVRVAAVLFAALTQGAVLVAYMVMWAVVPEEPLPGVAKPGSVTPADAEPTDDADPADATPGDATGTDGPQVVGEEGGAVMAEETQRPEKRARNGAGFGVFLVVLGCVLLINELFPSIDVWRYWPALIIIAGVVVLVRGLRRS